MSIIWIKRIGLLALLTLVFLYGVLTLTGISFSPLPPRFNSPDETANYFWANRLAHSRGLRLAEPLNAVAGQQIHLRSDNVTAAGDVVPGSFVGWIIFLGGWGWLVGSWAIPWVTPLLAVMALWCWYRLILKYVGRGAGVISAALLAVQPAWWYYATRGLFANVAVVALAIMAVWLFDRALVVSSRQRWWHLAAGVAAGLAVSIRPAELPWLVVIALTLVWRNWSRAWRPGLLLAVIGAGVVGLPTVMVQWWLYGSPLATGYQDLQMIAGPAATASWWALILPAGFHPLRALRHGYDYSFGLMGWWWIPVTVAGLLALWRSVRQCPSRPDWSRLVWWYTVMTVVVSGWLLLQYGSWSVRDNISGQITIGTAYLRYWLPIAVLATPYLGWLIAGGLRRITLPPVRAVVALGLLVWFIWPAYQLVVWSEEGVVPVAAAVAQYQTVNRVAVERLATDGQTPVIISDRSDKVFWPQLRTMTFLGNGTIWSPAAALARQVPVYYYSHNQLTSANLAIMKGFVQPLGCDWQVQASLTSVDGLYQLICQ